MKKIINIIAITIITILFIGCGVVNNTTLDNLIANNSQDLLALKKLAHLLSTSLSYPAEPDSLSSSEISVLSNFSATTKSEQDYNEWFDEESGTTVSVYNEYSYFTPNMEPIDPSEITSQDHIIIYYTAITCNKYISFEFAEYYKWKENITPTNGYVFEVATRNLIINYRNEEITLMIDELMYSTGNFSFENFFWDEETTETSIVGQLTFIYNQIDYIGKYNMYYNDGDPDPDPETLNPVFITVYRNNNAIGRLKLGEDSVEAYDMNGKKLK